MTKLSPRAIADTELAVWPTGNGKLVIGCLESLEPRLRPSETCLTLSTTMTSLLLRPALRRPLQQALQIHARMYQSFALLFPPLNLL